MPKHNHQRKVKIGLTKPHIHTGTLKWDEDNKTWYLSRFFLVEYHGRLLPILGRPRLKSRQFKRELARLKVNDGTR
jgi:hypothetical protein